MSRGINKVIIVGNVGNIESKFMPNGGQVVNISVATSENWKDKQTGEATERTEWHRVVIFNKLAEIASQYLTKGSKVYIEGSLRTRKWQDKQGQDRYTTEIVASEMQMLDAKGDQEKNTRESNSYAKPSSKPAVESKQSQEDIDSDDIPF